MGEQLGLPEDPLSRILSVIDRRTAAQSGWTFVMLSPQQNAAVVAHLSQHSKRPMVAMRLWSLLFTALRTDTGEICLTRSELSEALGIQPRTVSELMTELEAIRAIRRHRVGRGVRYYMNPNVGTHLPKEEREAAQKEFGQLTFDVIQGGQA